MRLASHGGSARGGGAPQRCGMHSAATRSSAREGVAPTRATPSRSAGKAYMRLSQHVALPAWKTLVTGLAMDASPRWHEDRLWLADWGAHESVAADRDSHSAVVVRPPCGLPRGIDWLPEGCLLLVSRREHRRWRPEPDGSLVSHVDRRTARKSGDSSRIERRASCLRTGPRLRSGRQALTTWVGAVAGLTLHAAHLSTVDEQGRMTDLAIFMGPVPRVEVFDSHLLPRIQGPLGPAFFDGS